ncbi:pectinesterase-like [Primulina eburnea]|uniref:pectinesterase-like n=1 Tax=Primulina eburnea TaxID=1245227 RepID=UPI003C6C36BA
MDLNRKTGKRSREKQSVMSCICIVLSFLSALQGVYPKRAFIVAQDGSGNFTTLSETISATPKYGSMITYIKIRVGIYHQNVFIPKEKINLHLLGDGMDRTKICGNRSTNMGFLTFEAATVRIVADGFVAKEITFENTAGVNMNQSVAVTNEGRYSAFYRCRFLSYQDTLYVRKNIRFFRECDIYGTVDFILGDARALFQNCNVYACRFRKGQSNTIKAQERKSDQYLSGIVMQNCTIVAAPDLRPRFNARTYLGRPRQNYSTTVIMQSFMDKLIDPRGWWEWPGHGLDTLFYAEYQNRGPGANTKNRVKWARTINYPGAKRFTARVFLKGEKWISSTGIPCYLDL